MLALGRLDRYAMRKEGMPVLRLCFGEYQGPSAWLVNGFLKITVSVSAVCPGLAVVNPEILEHWAAVAEPPCLGR